MGKKEGATTPYAVQGARLRARREFLLPKGRIEGVSDLKELAAAAGATVSAYLSWERGEYWPKGAKKVRLSKLMGWTEIELDHGPQPGSVDSPEVNRLIMAFGWLTDVQRKEVLADLEAKAQTNKTIAKELGTKFEFKTDSEVERHLKPVRHARRKS